MSKASLYRWSQSDDFLEISFDIHRANLSKPGSYDLYLTRSYIKFHLKSPKLFAEFDLQADIQLDSSGNRVFATENSLTIYLHKAEKGRQWTDLVCRDKELARERRKNAISERELVEKQAEIARKEAEIKLDRFAINEQMRLEGIQRKEIEDRKEREKQQEEEAVYRELEEKQWERRPKDSYKDVFESVPTRQPHSQQLSFTPRPVPTAPMRETQFTEPPKPTTLKELQGPAYDFHPVWIKAKADTLYGNEDYGSAITAYTEVLKAEPSNLPALLNRSAAFLRMWRLSEALHDLHTAEEVKVDPPNPKFSTLISVRKAVIAAWKGEFAESIDLLKSVMSSNPDIDLTSDIHKITLRRDSSVLKSQGDALYRQQNLPGAQEKYLSALEIDPRNEVVLANLAQIALKEGKWEKALEYCEQAIPLSMINQKLRVKLMVRQAKAYRELGEWESARKSVEQARGIEPENQTLARLTQEIYVHLQREKYEGLKKEADESLRSGHPADALQLYKDLLVTTRDSASRAALYTNICACHLMLGQYLDVVSVAERGLQLNPGTSVRLRLLSRRANAYSALGQVHSAIIDLRKALELDPENPALTQELSLLTQSRS